MKYIAPEVVNELKRMDLLTYLRTYEPYELVRFTGNTYTTKSHDSLKISNGKWMWWSKGIGGVSALDYLIKVKEMTFLEAVHCLADHGIVYQSMEEIYKEEEVPVLQLPERNESNRKVVQYLSGRGIDEEIIKYCIKESLIYESKPYHNAVFVGYDKERKPRYGAYRSTNKTKIMGDCKGSKKKYSFRLSKANSSNVHVFESAIDLLSYASLMKERGENWKDSNLLSLAGIYQSKEGNKIPAPLEFLLKEEKQIQQVVLHLDNDSAGRGATLEIKKALRDRVKVIDDPAPSGKDFNDFLCSQRIKRIGKRREER